MAKKFYAVKKGIVPGIYTSWGECQQNINGFSGALYKGFSSEAEAKEFMGESLSNENKEEQTARIYSESDAVAYVDGSYNVQTNEYSYGVVMFYDGGEEHFSQKFNDPEMAQMRNVAGEIEGAMCAMKFCNDNYIKSIDIFYDYEGIEKWCTGAWQAKKDGTKEYKRFYNSISKTTKVSFVKVKGHSGDIYNDLADQLAKEAIGIGDSSGMISVRNNGMVANGIKEDDLKSVFELLQEDFMDLKIIESEIPYGNQYSLNISNPNKQKLTVNFYNSKNKIWISGRKEDLFNQFSLYIVELLEIDEIPMFLNTVHNLSIDRDVVKTEFERFFPNSYDKIPNELNNYLHQAVYNLHITGNVYVANFLVEPALRSFEGILKLALINNGFPVRKEDKDYDSFFIFKEKNGSFVVKQEFVGETTSIELLKYLGKAYTYFNNNRHTLFHWDNPTETKDTTRILNTVEEANVIIRDTISLIDEYFTV